MTDQLSDPDSILNVYRNLLGLRKNNPALQSGMICLIPATLTEQYVLAYSRVKGDCTFLVVINFGTSESVFHNDTQCRKLIYAIEMELDSSANAFVLPPLSGVILSNYFFSN